MMWPPFYRPPGQVMLISEVIAFVARDFGIEPSQIIGKGRARESVNARVVLAQLLRRKGLSSADTGRRLRRDHTTILHSWENWTKYLQDRPELGEALTRAELFMRGATVRALKTPIIIPNKPTKPTKPKKSYARLIPETREELDEDEGLAARRDVRAGSFRLAQALAAR